MNNKLYRRVWVKGHWEKVEVIPEKKRRIDFAKVMLVFTILSLLFFFSLIADSFNDIRVCSNEFYTVTNITLDSDSSFANDDMYRLNFGKNIHCDVFWVEDNYLTNVEFKSGTLTKEMIESQRYWRHNYYYSVYFEPKFYD